MEKIIFEKLNNFLGNKNNFRGFTLIELLVTITIFSIMVGSATVILSTTLKGQRNAFATQQAIDQTSFAMEYLSRAVRMAQAGTLEISRGGMGVKFINSSGELQEIFVENGKINQSKGGETTNLTSGDIEVTAASFIQSGTSLPAKITIALTIKTIGTRPEEITEIKLQTSISQRNME